MLRTKMKLTDIGFVNSFSQILESFRFLLDFWITIDIKFYINQLLYKDATQMNPVQEHYFSFFCLQ
jgi:hypothetical protein